MTISLAALSLSSLGVAEVWATASFVVKAIIILMLAMGLACIYVAIERWVSFFKAQAESRALSVILSENFEKKDIKAAISACQDEEYKRSYLSHVLEPALKEIDERLDRHGIDAATRALESAAIIESSDLKRGMPILATVGSTSPFVGLVGTIFGIIHTFQSFGGDGGGDLLGIIGQIGEALYATAVGIAVAIIGVWLYNYFNSRIDRITQEITLFAQEFLGWCEKEILKDDTKA